MLGVTGLLDFVCEPINTTETECAAAMNDDRKKDDDDDDGKRKRCERRCCCATTSHVRFVTFFHLPFPSIISLSCQP